MIEDVGEVTPMRKKIKCLYYAQIPYMILLCIFLGIMEGLFELCMVWMLHYTWATCSYCQCIFTGVFFIMNAFTTISYGMSGHWILLCMAVYNILGVFWSY